MTNRLFVRSSCRVVIRRVMRFNTCANIRVSHISTRHNEHTLKRITTHTRHRFICRALCMFYGASCFDICNTCIKCVRRVRRDVDTVERCVRRVVSCMMHRVVCRALCVVRCDVDTLTRRCVVHRVNVRCASCERALCVVSYDEPCDACRVFYDEPCDALCSLCVVYHRLYIFMYA